jgi:Leucine-rich repeat (LRR) protein
MPGLEEVAVSGKLNLKNFSVSHYPFPGADTIKVLRLSHTDISIGILDYDIQNSKLEKINMSHNKISMVTDNVSFPLTLRDLDLSFNEIKEFPYVINITHWSGVRPVFKLFPDNANIETINLQHNKITTIDLNYFKNLPRLKLIDLRNNLIDKVKIADQLKGNNYRFKVLIE